MKKKIKQWSAMLLCMIMAVCMSIGCGNSSNGNDDTEIPEEVEGSSTDYEITVICMALNSDYWHMVEAGAKLAGEELGVTVDVIGPNAESDSASQINMVEDACNSGADAIVLAPNEPTSLVSAAKTAKNNDIPLVIIDAMLDTDDEELYSCFIGTGNEAAGAEGGNFM